VKAQPNKKGNTMKKLLAVEAPIGDRMIEVRVKFWTNDIAGKNGNVWPKHAWDHGVVMLTPNKSHGIVWGDRNPRQFDSLLDLTTVIAGVLREHEVTLHAGRTLRKLIQPIVDLKHQKQVRKRQ